MNNADGFRTAMSRAYRGSGCETIFSCSWRVCTRVPARSGGSRKGMQRALAQLSGGSCEICWRATMPASG